MTTRIKLTSYLYANYAFLFKGNRTKFVSSITEGANEAIVVENGELRLRFVRDRDQISLELQSLSMQTKEWFSIDVIRQLITGEVLDKSILDNELNNFVENNLKKITNAFKRENLPETLSTLHEFEMARAKRIFS